MNAADQLRFRTHAASLGMKGSVSNKYGEVSTAFLMSMDDLTKFILMFSVEDLNLNYVQVKWFVGGKQYNTSITLDQFLQLNTKTMEDFRRGNARANQEAASITKRLKEIPKTFKADTLVLLGIK